jgi:hypothetical protein
MQNRIHRAADDRSTIAEMLIRTRELVAESVKILERPTPDTFLGRQRRDDESPLLEPRRAG